MSESDQIIIPKKIFVSYSAYPTKGKSFVPIIGWYWVPSPQTWDYIVKYTEEQVRKSSARVEGEEYNILYTTISEIVLADQ